MNHPAISPDLQTKLLVMQKDEITSYHLFERAGLRIQSADYNDSFGATYLCVKS